jgi:hypothetical protein
VSLKEKQYEYIDWGSKPICKKHPDSEVVWLVEKDQPTKASWCVHLLSNSVKGLPNRELYLEIGSGIYGYWTVDGPAYDNQWYTVYRDPRDKYEKGLSALDKAMDKDVATELSQLRDKVAKLESALVKINSLSPESNDTQYISDYENQVMCIAYEAMEEKNENR